MQLRCRINAYCLMDNHVHLLLVPLIESGLSRMMQKLSLRYTQYVNKKYTRTGRLWECRFYSSIVEKDSYLWHVSRYIERNPVRAKFVVNPNDYVWSSAGNRSLGKQNNLSIDPIWRDENDKKGYIVFLNLPESEGEIDNIRKCLKTGKPLGKSSGFAEQIANTIGIELPLRPKGRPRAYQRK